MPASASAVTAPSIACSDKACLIPRSADQIRPRAQSSLSAHRNLASRPAIAGLPHPPQRADAGAAPVGREALEDPDEVRVVAQRGPDKPDPSEPPPQSAMIASLRAHSHRPVEVAGSAEEANRAPPPPHLQQGSCHRSGIRPAAQGRAISSQQGSRRAPRASPEVARRRRRSSPEPQAWQA